MQPSAALLLNLVPSATSSPQDALNIIISAQTLTAASISSSYRMLDVELTLGATGNQ
jgi:hypothetical protein